MLHSISLLPLLLPTLLAPATTSPAVTPARDLLAAVPASAILAVNVPNPKALIASRETNDLIAFAMDPEWQAITNLLLAEFEEEELAAEIETWRKTVISALSDATGLVLFVDPGFGDNGPTLGIIAEGGPDTTAFLRGLLPSDAALSIDNGTMTTVMTADQTEVFHSSNGLAMVISSSSKESAVRVSAACLTGIDGPAPRGPFAVPAIAAERRPAAVEIAVNLSLLWAELERTDSPAEGIERQIADAVSTVDWMYGSVSFGKDEESDWEFVVPYGTETLLGGLLGFFGQADSELLATIPAGASSGMVLAFDVAGFTDWALELVRSTSPETHEMMMSGLSAITEMVGIDIMGDVVHNMTGQFLTFTSTATVSSEGSVLAGMQATTVVISVKDAEPFVDMVDGLLEMGGFGSAVESSTVPIEGDDDGVELWRVDPGLGTELIIAAGAGRIALSIDSEGFEKYLARASADEGVTSFLSDPAMAKAAESLSGAVVSIQSMAAGADAFQASMRNVESMLSSFPSPDGEAAPLGQMMEAADRLVVLVRQYFEGTITSELQIADGRIRYRSRTR